MAVARPAAHRLETTMKHSLALVSVTTLFAATAGAQCFTVSGTSIANQLTPTGALPADDEGVSGDIAINGFSIPIGSGSYSHFVVDSNGVLYFTDGTGVTNVPVGGIDSLADLRGGVGGSPRATAFSGDFEAAPGSWDILVDNPGTGEVKVTWTGMRYTLGTGNFGMSVRFNASGRIWFDYSADDFGIPTTSNFAGISAGDDVGTAASPPVDINTVNVTGALALIYQDTWPPFDLPGTSVRFARIGTGGYVSSQECGKAAHELFGVGCSPRESFYQLFTDAAVASATLTGNGILMSPTANGYDVNWVPGIAASLFIPPTPAATNLPVLNDGEITLPLVNPLATPFGTVNDLTVTGNGIIAFGPGPTEAGAENWVADPVVFAGASHGGVYCWHPYNEEEGGDVWGEELGGITYITFDNVENFPDLSPNPSTFQVQFNQATGEIWMLFVSIDDDNSIILGIWGQDHLIGYTPPSASLVPTGIDLPTQLPVSLNPDLPSLAVSATSPMTSTTSAGSTTNYTIDNAPEIAAGAGAAVGLLIFSVSSVPGGLDLGVLGAPGCFAYVGGLDVSVSFVGPPGTFQVPLTVPAGVTPGTVIYAQAAALLPSFNAGGLMTSNAVKTTISGS